MQPILPITKAIKKIKVAVCQCYGMNRPLVNRFGARPKTLIGFVGV